MRQLICAGLAAAGLSLVPVAGAMAQTVVRETTTTTYDYGPYAYGYRAPVDVEEYRAPVTVYRRYEPAPPPVVVTPRTYVGTTYYYRPPNCGTYHYWRDGVCVDARD
jgi:hypothetical protein